MRKFTEGERCPICDCEYEKNLLTTHSNIKTKHHIFPKYWYKGGVKVYACYKCHIAEFDVIYRMDTQMIPWTPSECLQNWIKFCKSKGKDAFKIYPELKELSCLY